MNRFTNGDVARRVRRLGLGAALVWVAFAAIDLSANQQTAPGLALKNGSRLWLEGTSTLHAFKSTATQLQVAFTHDKARWPEEPSSPETIEQIMRQGGVSALEVAVPVAEMRSGKGGLDRNMQKALKATEHPSIRFRLERYDVASGSTPEEFVILAHGWVAVAGVERPMELSVTARREAEGIRLRGKKQLLMSEFEVRPPKMMMGAVRTGDQITVAFDLMIGPGGLSASSTQP